MNQALGESSDGGRRFSVVLVFRIVLGHGDKFAADIVPLFEQAGRLAGSGVWCSGFFRGVLGVYGRMRGKNQECRGKKYG